MCVHVFVHVLVRLCVASWRAERVSDETGHWPAASSARYPIVGTK